MKKTGLGMKSEVQPLALESSDILLSAVDLLSAAPVLVFKNLQIESKLIHEATVVPFG